MDLKLFSSKLDQILQHEGTGFTNDAKKKNKVITCLTFLLKEDTDEDLTDEQVKDIIYKNMSAACAYVEDSKVKKLTDNLYLTLEHGGLLENNLLNRILKEIKELEDFNVNAFRGAFMSKQLEIDKNQIYTRTQYTELILEILNIQPYHSVLENSMGLLMMVEPMIQHRLKLAKTQAEKDFILGEGTVGIERDEDIFIMAMSQALLKGYENCKFLLGPAQDFKLEKNVDLAILNPPFSHIKKIMQHALDHADQFVALLAPISFKSKLDFSNYRREILEQHSLRGIIHLDPKLFQRKDEFNSKPKGVECAFYLIKTNKPHDINSEIIYHEIADDGFNQFSKVKWEDVKAEVLNKFKTKSETFKLNTLDNWEHKEKQVDYSKLTKLNFMASVYSGRMQELSNQLNYLARL